MKGGKLARSESTHSNTLISLLAGFSSFRILFISFWNFDQGSRGATDDLDGESKLAAAGVLIIGLIDHSAKQKVDVAIINKVVITKT